MTERELEQGVIQAARLLGYAVHHTRPARTLRGWRTPISGDAGFPDLVLCGRGRLLLRELKVGRGRLSAEQRHWLELLQRAGVDADVWTDADWLGGRILSELRAPGAPSWRSIAESALDALHRLLVALGDIEGIPDEERGTLAEMRSTIADALALVQELRA